MMISGGNATIFISDMDRAVRFYTEVLELRLLERYGNDWARVDAGKGLIIGLHHTSPNYPSPGTKGATMLGLETKENIDGLVSRLKDRGVRIAGEIVRSENGNFAHFADPDGNDMYLWETIWSDTTNAETARAASEQG
jgi:predicted enzyme related to lactoylglutathione lyase